MDPESYYTPEEVATIAAAKSELKKTKASHDAELVATRKAMMTALEVHARAKTENSAVEAKVLGAHKKFNAVVGPINSLAFQRKQEAETGLSMDELLARRVKELGGAGVVLDMLESCRDDDDSR